ncbi:MAG: cobalt ECF transporter T component CbiQ [Chloroflexota bacterium]|nr:cobalt ECF transporter T component CbiQ [Chloroflexota bacterium]
MKFGFDEYVHLSSPLHRWDARYKLVGLMALIFAFAFVRDLRMLPAMLLATAVAYSLSRLPPSFLFTRLRYPSLFVVVVVLLLPFLSGQTTLVSLGPIDVRQEGLIAAILIATRFLCILTVGLVLFGTASFLRTVEAMHALRVPDILTDMALLAYRYMFEIGDYLHRMEAAMRLRGFRERLVSIDGLRTLAWLGGSILVRSYERSEWVYKAMILRGYGEGEHGRGEFQANRGDVIAFVGALVVAGAFIAAEYLI